MTCSLVPAYPLHIVVHRTTPSPGRKTFLDLFSSAAPWDPVPPAFVAMRAGKGLARQIGRARESQTIFC